MAESAPLIEDEFAQLDDMGLQQLTEKTETEDQSFAKYLKMLMVAIPLIGLAFAVGTYFASVYLLGGKTILETKFSFIKEYQLSYIFLAVWLVGYTRSALGLVANAARAGARLDRPDQHVYKIMACSGPMKDAPYVLMANTGAVGRFNRAQRAVFNTDESMPLFLMNTVLASGVFGPVILVPLLLYCYGRLTFAVKYKNSLKERGAGFLPSMIGEKWIEGLTLFSAIKGFFF